MGNVYAQLSLSERGKIENWWHAKVPGREMARVLKRSKATIHREIKRNFWVDDALPKKYTGYFGHAAQLQTDKRRSVQRKARRPPRARKRQKPKFDRDVSILFRPDDVVHRRQFGHWE